MRKIGGGRIWRAWTPDERQRNRKKNNPRWKQQPDPGVFKLNTDVAVNQTGRARLGFVVRGH